MALKALMLRKQIDTLKNQLNGLDNKYEELNERHAELETAIGEMNEETTQEERDAVNEAVDAYENDKNELDEKKDAIEEEIADLEGKLAEEESKQEVPVDEPKPEEERKDNKEMENRKFTEEEMQARKAFVDYVKGISTRDDYNMTQGNNGAVVPKTIADEIVTKVKEICPIYEKAHKYAIGGTLEIPYYPYSTDHVISAAYQNEMASLTASSGDFGAIELTGFVAGALAKISKKLINNTNVDVVPFIVDQMAEAFKSFIEQECIKGTNNKVTGMLAGIDADATITASKLSSITADELIECQMKVPTALQSECAWVMAPATFTKLRKLKDTTNNYLLTHDFAEGFGYRLLGKPVYLSDNMPALGTANNKAVVYCDFSGLAIKTAEELEIQVLNEKYADVHAVGVIGWTEFDAKVENAQKFACIKCGAAD